MFRRFLATKASSRGQYNVFDRAAKLIQRDRAALVQPQEARKAEYLRDEVAIKTIERLAFITRPLDRVLDFGSNSGNLMKQLCTETTAPESADEQLRDHITQLNKDKAMIRSKIKEYTMFDSSAGMINRDAQELFWSKFGGKVNRIVGDEETFSHPELQEADKFDAVILNLSLHWINDLPLALLNINKVLKPDGLFLGTLFGGDTLYELRTSLQLAELERCGGISPRVSPLVELNDVGTLLNRAGFSMLTMDPEDIVVGGFPDVAAVCNDLQLMGEQNVVLSRSNYLSRDLLLATNEIYKTLHGEKDDKGEITLPATFSIIFMIGWKKSDTQPQPLPRGSGQVNLKDVL